MENNFSTDNNNMSFVIRGGVLEKYTGAATDVEIPSNVAVIGEKAFEQCRRVKHIVIPSSVEKIENEAFCNCENLTNIELPRGLQEIGEKSFIGCRKLESIIIPPNIAEIKGETFAYCNNLVSVILSEGVKIIGRGAFSGCISLKSITFPASLENICVNAFLNSGITTILSNNPQKTIKLEYGVSGSEDGWGTYEYRWHDAKVALVKTLYIPYYYYSSPSPYNLPSPYNRVKDAPFLHTPFYDKIQIDIDIAKEQEQRQNRQRDEWKRQGRCYYCGSQLIGVLKKTCSNPKCCNHKDNLNPKSCAITKDADFFCPVCYSKVRIRNAGVGKKINITCPICQYIFTRRVE